MPSERSAPQKAKRLPNGRFPPGTSGNPAGNPASAVLAGAPSRREDTRWHLRRILEVPESEYPKVDFCKGAKLARRMVESAIDADDPVRSGKAVIEAAYGTHHTVVDETQPRPLEAVKADIAAEIDSIVRQLSRAR